MHLHLETFVLTSYDIWGKFSFLVPYKWVVSFSLRLLLMMSFTWIFVINILSAIFYIIKIPLSIIKLFWQIREHTLETRQGLEIIHVDNNTSTSRYVVLYSFTVIFTIYNNLLQLYTGISMTDYLYTLSLSFL